MLHFFGSTKFLSLAIGALSCGLCHGIDRDRNGLDDKWQQLQGISEPSGDFDGDGITNYAEYRFGTDPKNAQSKIGLSVSRAANGSKTIAWTGQLHKRYLVQYSEDMVNWYSFSGVLDGTGSSQSVQDANNWPSKRFYRLAAQESLDSDGDGVDDWLEMNVYASDRLDALDWLGDTDKDRVPDIYEETKGTDKNDPNSTPAADLFVNPLTGNSSWTDNIHATIQEAINAAPSTDANGDRRRIISVKPGTYLENLYIPDAKKVILLAESAAEETIIHSPNFNPLQLYSSGCVLDGFVFSRKGSPTASYTCVYFYVHSAYASSILSNCIIREGYAGSGGGIYIGQGNLIAEHCTIANNQASAEASAVYIGNSSKLTLRNSIIWGNFGSAPQAIKRATGTSQISVTNSWIQGGEQGGIASDPLISLTGHLTATSPARNISPAITALKKDIHGELRDTLPDAGADEFASSDGDSLPDFWETQFFGNLTQGDGGDSDNDGLGNLAEFAVHFTKPNVADTDDDGLHDGAEITAGTKPLIPDTDGDGMFDGYELHADNVLNPLIDDSLEDKDGDRVPNIFEFMRGRTRANDPSSKPTTTYLVNPATGGNSSTDNIHPTIQAAIAAASQPVYNSTTQQNEYPGRYAVIEVAAGTYPEQVNLTTVPVLLVGELGAASGPVMLTGSSAFDSSTLNISTASVVDGFVITHSAGRKGLGVQVSQASATDSKRRRLVNCIIRGNDNSNSYGGAINQSNSLLDLVHCTITGNQSNHSARGIYSAGGKLSLINSIVWGNSGTATAEIYKYTTDPISVVSSIIASGEHGGIDIDPALHQYGWLKSTSTAIKRSGVVLVEASRFDIHGEVRDNNPDIGADEFFSIDSDSLPDFWERQYFGNLTKGDQDDNDAPAGDGLTNYYEYRFGFNPLLPLSTGNAVSDFYEAVFLRKNEANYPQEWRSDEDLDGLTAGEELFYGSDPQLLDSNGDGIVDLMAVFLGISPSSTDTDGDGVSNALETANGTNLIVADTDGDAVADNLDAYPLDPERSTFTPGSAGDGVAPTITLLEPFGAVLVP